MKNVGDIDDLPLFDSAMRFWMLDASLDSSLRRLWLQTYVHILDSGVISIKGVNATYGTTTVAPAV